MTIIEALNDIENKYPDYYGEFCKAARSIHLADNTPADTEVLWYGINGNYLLMYLDNGTKIKATKWDDTEFRPENPECIDCSITTVCDGNCPYCYMGCSKDGTHASLFDDDRDLMFPLNTITEGTELAINGNDLSHPDLEEFLKVMNNRGVIVNITLKFSHIVKHIDTILKWSRGNIIYGIGISVPSIINDEDLEKLNIMNRLFNDRMVCHTIVGIHGYEEIKKLSDNGIRVLVLGYKESGKGSRYHGENQMEVYRKMHDLKSYLEIFWNQFKSISFDGLALEQLSVKSWLPDNVWEKSYAGDEGEYSFYLDMVNQKYAMNSIQHTMSKPIGRKSIKELFQNVRRDRECTT